MKSLDEVLKKLEKEAAKANSKYRPIWEGTEDDDIYSVDIHIWRKPGMGNSLQKVVGNQISIMTATTSYLNTLLINKVISVKDLDNIVKLVKENYNGDK